MERIESVDAQFRDMSQPGGGEILPLSLHLMKSDIEGLIVPKMMMPDEHRLPPTVQSAIRT
jgi:hypothetical protein